MTGAYNKIKMCHQKNYWKGGYTETSYICCFICDFLQIFSFFPLSLSFFSSFFLIRIKKIRFLTIPDSINSTELYSLLHYFWSALHTSMNLWYFLPSKDMTRKKTRSGKKHWIHFMQADKKQHWNKFSEKVVDAPSLEIFKAHLDWPLSNSLYLRCPSSYSKGVRLEGL